VRTCDAGREGIARTPCPLSFLSPSRRFAACPITPHAG
jgi:hypothetical protein